MHEHPRLPGLLDLANTGAIGGPLFFLPLAAAPAVAPAGFGGTRALVKFNPGDLTDPTQPQKVQRVPRVLTASIYGTGSSGMGPLVGVARWGSGNGAQQEIEFDIPLALFNASVSNLGAGGALLAVPATSLEIFARNDGNLTPRAGDDPIGGGAAPPVQQVPPAGTIGGFPNATAGFAIGHKQGNARLTRTIWAVNGNGGLLAAGHIDVPVPAWAQTVRVLRSDAGNTISVTLFSMGLLAEGGPWNEAANAAPTVYSLPSSTGIIRVTNTGAGAINVVQLLFELGL
jgi:hypothetical protein